jgi:type IV secretion system protein VirB2
VISLKKTAFFILFVFFPSLALASGSGMPWETPLTTLMNSATGPVAQVIGVVAIIATGIGVAYSEHGSTAMKLYKTALGLVVTFTASSFFLSFLGFGGGVGF